MFEAKLSSKGQITIPAEIRRMLNIKSGDKIYFRNTEHGVVMDTGSRPLTIQARFANSDIRSSNQELKRNMREYSMSDHLGEEQV